MLWWIY